MSDVKIFASIVDDVTKKQVEELSESDAYNGCKIRVMPDCHKGMGCTIGSVIRFADRIVPNTVGVDIGCGMLVVCLGQVDIDLAYLDEVINDVIPAGFHKVHNKPIADFDFNRISAKLTDVDYLHRSIGTLGSGNHFIEVDVDDECNKYLVIHSGSRNLGKQVCDYWQNVGYSHLTDDSEIRKELIARLKAEGRDKEIGKELQKLQKPKVNKDLAYIDGYELDLYLDDMRRCNEYATLNRHTMADIILSHMALDCCIKGMFTTIHNYVNVDDRIIRKGAISAKKDELVIIPMNMRDGSLICKGKGNEDWLCSAPHGAGRIMSRAQAIKNLSLAEYEAEMSSVYTTSVCKETIDEAPMVYKPIETIMSDIKDTVEIVKAIQPIYNFKAKEG